MATRANAAGIAGQNAAFSSLFLFVRHLPTLNNIARV